MRIGFQAKMQSMNNMSMNKMHCINQTCSRIGTMILDISSTYLPLGESTHPLGENDLILPYPYQNDIR
jgi:hypothetical protein